MGWRRIEINDLFKGIIAEAEVALRRKNFESQVEHLHRLVFTIEDRIKRWEDEQKWTEIDRMMEKAKRDDPFSVFERIEGDRIERPGKSGGDKGEV